MSSPDSHHALKSWVGGFIEHQKKLLNLETSIFRTEHEIRWEHNRIQELIGDNRRKTHNKEIKHYQYAVRKREIELAFMYDDYYKLKGIK